MVYLVGSAQVSTPHSFDLDLEVQQVQWYIVPLGDVFRPFMDQYAWRVKANLGTTTGRIMHTARHN